MCCFIFPSSRCRTFRHSFCLGFLFLSVCTRKATEENKKIIYRKLYGYLVVLCVCFFIFCRSTMEPRHLQDLSNVHVTIMQRHGPNIRFASVSIGISRGQLHTRSRAVTQYSKRAQQHECQHHSSSDSSNKNQQQRIKHMYGTCASRRAHLGHEHVRIVWKTIRQKCEHEQQSAATTSIGAQSNRNQSMSTNVGSATSRSDCINESENTTATSTVEAFVTTSSTDVIIAPLLLLSWHVRQHNINNTTIITNDNNTNQQQTTTTVNCNGTKRCAEHCLLHVLFVVLCLQETHENKP